MRRLLLACYVVVLAATWAQAQTPVPSPTPPTTQLCWNHDGQRISPGEQGRFTLAIDGGTAADLGLPAPTGTTYCIQFPALTPGAHTLVLSACNIAACAAAPPFPVSVVVSPTAPTNLRVVSP